MLLGMETAALPQLRRQPELLFFGETRGRLVCRGYQAHRLLPGYQVFIRSSHIWPPKFLRWAEIGNCSLGVVIHCIGLW